MIFYGPKETPEAPKMGQEVDKEATSPLGAPFPPGRVLQACGPLGHPLDVRPMLIILINTQTSEKNLRSEVPPPQASIHYKEKTHS